MLIHYIPYAMQHKTSTHSPMTTYIDAAHCKEAAMQTCIDPGSGRMSFLL